MTIQEYINQELEMAHNAINHPMHKDNAQMKAFWEGVEFALKEAQKFIENNK